MKPRRILLAAGGTGGHLFPAAALAQELQRRGYVVGFGDGPPRREIWRRLSRPQNSPHPVGDADEPLAARRGRHVRPARPRLPAPRACLLLQVRPKAVIGFGGYPTLPPIIAASTLRIPTAIHEQNAVMGRANRLLSRYVDKIALSFMPTKLLEPAAEAKARLTGIPVRDSVHKFRGVPYAPPYADSRLLLLVFGGSQGARFFSEIMPPALLQLPPEIRWRLTVVQQAREEDLEGLRAAYAKARHRRACRALLQRSAGADRHGPARHRPGRRLDRGGADRDRKTWPPRAVAARP